MPTPRTVRVKTSGGDYTSLTAAVNGEVGNLVSLDRNLIIECYSMNDTSNTNFSGWTTDSTRNIRVTVPTAERHSGKLDTAKYYHSGGISVITNAINITFEGVQVIRTGLLNPGGNLGAFFVGSTSSGRINARFDKCIASINGTGGSTQYFGWRISDGFLADTVTLTNCIAQDCYNTDYPTHPTYGGTGIGYDYVDELRIYNCTFYKNNRNLVLGDHASYDIAVYNTLAASARGGTDWTGGIDAGSNNASSDATALGASARTNQTFTFVSTSGTYDLHLQSGDGGAKDFGVSDPGSGLFSDDIDGVTRTGSWDIGADEYVSAGTTYDDTLSDGSKSGDTNAQTLLLTKTTSDGAKSGDTLAATGDFSRTVSDGAKSGDTYVGGFQVTVTTFDGAKSGDTNVQTLLLNVGVSDGAKSGDTQLQTIATTKLCSDGAKSGDTFNIEGNVDLTVNDGAKSGDVNVATGTFNHSVSDGSKSGDTQVSLKTIDLNVADGSKGGDTNVSQLSALGVITEGNRSGDILIATGTFNHSVTDGSKQGDSVGIVGTVDITISEGAKSGDTYNKTAIVTCTTSDGARSGDTEIATLLLTKQVTETIISGNTTSGWLTTTVQAVNGMVVSDQYSATGGAVQNLSLEMEFFIKNVLDMKFSIIPGGLP